MDTKEQMSDDNRVLGDTENRFSKDLDTIQSSSDRRPPAKQERQPPTSTLYEHITPDQHEVLVCCYTVYVDCRCHEKTTL